MGKHIAAAAAPMMKKLSLELGGKNAAIVYDDADLDKVSKDPSVMNLEKVPSVKAKD